MNTLLKRMTELTTIIGEQRGTIEKQKLVIDELNENYLKLNAKFDASEAKVEAANKLLDSEWMPYQVQQRLKKVLQIPRSDEQKLTCDKTREPPCHLEPSPELCAKCELNNYENKDHK